jgi:hypothetical protein
MICPGRADLVIWYASHQDRDAIQKILITEPFFWDTLLPYKPLKPAHCFRLTAYDDEVYVRNLVGLGVAGYILKDEAPETLIRAIHAA